MTKNIQLFTLKLFLRIFFKYCRYFLPFQYVAKIVLRGKKNINTEKVKRMRHETLKDERFK